MIAVCIVRFSWNFTENNYMFLNVDWYFFFRLSWEQRRDTGPQVANTLPSPWQMGMEAKIIPHFAARVCSVDEPRTVDRLISRHVSSHGSGSGSSPWARTAGMAATTTPAGSERVRAPNGHTNTHVHSAARGETWLTLNRCHSVKSILITACILAFSEAPFALFWHWFTLKHCVQKPAAPPLTLTVYVLCYWLSIFGRKWYEDRRITKWRLYRDLFL